jgi:hypothetical protein
MVSQPPRQQQQQHNAAVGFAAGSAHLHMSAAWHHEHFMLNTVNKFSSLSVQRSSRLIKQVVELSTQHLFLLLHSAALLIVCVYRFCNREIIGKVQQVICFAFHDSRLLLETCAEAKDSKKIVTLFYLD